MLGFSWVDIDWIKWMPLEVLVLAILIFIIRILRRTFRWKNIQISRTFKEKKGTNIGEITIYGQQEVNLALSTNDSIFKNYSITLRTSPQKQAKKILYIPGLTGFSKHSNFLPQSCTLLGYDVLQITPNQFSILQIEYHQDPDSFFRFLSKENIHIVICFDYASPFFFSIMKSSEKSNEFSRYLNQIQWIFIRPLFEWHQLRNRFQFVPFTIGWFNLLKLKLYLRKSSKKYLIEESLKYDDLRLIFQECQKIALIVPRKFSLSPKQEKMLILLDDLVDNEDFENLIYYNIQKGDWDFYQNETVLIGLISNLLLN